MVYFDAMGGDVAVEVDAGVAVLTLNRPEQLNAYTAEMGALLSRAYRDCDDDDTCGHRGRRRGPGVLRRSGFSGSASPFGAPADGSGFTASPIDPAAFEIRKPVIAALNGHAIAIGLTIALEADMRIAAEDAKYAVAQVRRGVIPDCMSHWTLAQLTNLGVAAEVLLIGRIAALETQLHQRVIRTDDAREGVAAFLDRRAPRLTARISAEWTALPEPEV